MDLALAFGGEVVNCDSVQVYRHLNIGAAKLPEPERHGVPHHLIDVVEPDQIFTAGEYLRLGRTLLNQIRERQRIPIVAGGTGLYLKALLEGLLKVRNDPNHYGPGYTVVRSKEVQPICIVCCHESIPVRPGASHQTTSRK